jgi:hypothetical protein
MIRIAKTQTTSNMIMEIELCKCLMEQISLCGGSAFVTNIKALTYGNALGRKGFRKTAQDAGKSTKHAILGPRTAHPLVHIQGFSVNAIGRQNLDEEFGTVHLKNAPKKTAASQETFLVRSIP